MHDPPTTVIAVMHVELHIPMCNSLKEKRSVLRPCVQHLQQHFRIAVAEVGDQDVWRSAILAAVAVSADRQVAESILRQAQRFLETHRHLLVTNIQVEIL